MLRRSYVSILVMALSAPIALAAQQQDEFQQRRQAVRSKMEPNSVLILRSQQQSGRSGRFRPDNNFFYLAGIDVPGASLVLYPKPERASGQRTERGRPVMQEILFVSSERAEGQAPDLNRRPEYQGFPSVRPSTDFPAYLERVLLGTSSVIYFDPQRSRSLSAPLTADEHLLKAARDRGASFTLKETSVFISPLRRIKSTAEIDLLKTAIAITMEAQKEVMRTASPGMYEYQLQSVIEHVFSFNGAQRPGFSSIVGSGKNSCILHWSENTRKTEDGDLVVIDIGAEYEMYTADITRTIPINGKFTRRQKEIYEIVLRANQAAIDMVGPGVNMSDVSEKVRDIQTEGLVALGLIKDKSQLRQYYYHGLSHPIGLQVHDVGGLGVLEPGMVITIEPGIYIREEGMGVRIEDDVLVTEDGHVNLTIGVPKTVEDVEAMMKEEGLGFSRYFLRRR